MDDFLKPKIVYPETTQGAYFAIDNDGIYLDKICFMLISPFASYLQKTLSSKLFEFVYKHILTSVELGTNGYQYNKHALIKLPIRKDTIKELYNETEIDRKVYELYGLTEEEIGVVEGADVETQNFASLPVA